MGSGLGGFRKELSAFRKVTIDTMCCIYYIERKAGPVQPHADVLFELARSGRTSLELSGITRLELMVGPMRSGDPRQMDRVRKLIERSPGVTNAAMSEDVLFAAASIRGATRLKVPDALVAGSALIGGSQAIVGNDRAFSSLRGIETIRIWGAARTYRMPKYIQIDDYLDEA